jgi:hypothetical protein
VPWPASARRQCIRAGPCVAVVMAASKPSLCTPSLSSVGETSFLGMRMAMHVSMLHAEHFSHGSGSDIVVNLQIFSILSVFLQVYKNKFTKNLELQFCFRGLSAARSSKLCTLHSDLNFSDVAKCLCSHLTPNVFEMGYGSD